MIELTVIDDRAALDRRMWGVAQREAFESGIVEASPPDPKYAAIVTADGVPVARVRATQYELCQRRPSIVRALTPEELALPEIKIDTGWGYYAGGSACLPDGRALTIGHALSAA